MRKELKKVMEKYIIMKKVNKFKLLAAGLLIGVAFWLLGSDFFTFMIWWEILWILGLVFMPITAQIFKGFDDNGWMYSKVIAIVICGYGVWILTSIKVVHFTTLSSIVITTLCGGAVLLMEYMENKERFFRGNIWNLFIGKK